LEIAYAMDCALGSKSSEGGMMLEKIITQKSAQTLFQNMQSGKKGKGEPLDKLNDMFGDMTNPHNNTDFGNSKY